jgi:DNA-binding MarR family transcriptional regulator
MTVMPGSLPLPALLSHALVAFTIEFDNEFEAEMPHRTAASGPSPLGDGPWLVSLVMWANCMRFVDDAGLTVIELRRLARTGTNLDGMRRWRYVLVDDSAARPRRVTDGSVLRATANGLRARQAWQPLPARIEDRWQSRFGAGAVGRLRQSLRAVASQLDPRLPDCLPILHHGLWSSADAVPGKASRALSARRDPPEAAVEVRAARMGSGAGDAPADQLWSLLSRVLLAFAIEYEADAPLSLAVSANLLRVLGEQPVRLRDLPACSGVSKESIAMALGIAGKAGLVVQEPDQAGSRGKTVSLTARGVHAQRGYFARVADAEQAFRSRFGDEVISGLRAALEPLAESRDGQPSPLLGGLDPYPDGWRASAGRPATLPHYPMVLHRGGYPDGS